MKIVNVNNCIFSSWYPKYKDVTVKSIIIPLPKEFVDYLLADGIVLPESEVQNETSTLNTSADEDEDQSEVVWDDSTGTEAKAPEFPELEDEIKKVIQKLGGKVFPKLNWSAPRDATWISYDKSLMCTCPNDIYLLLKSSDFIAHDLTQPFISCTDYTSQGDVKYELVLRRWRDILPGSEFRCFVKNNKLLGITQRHHIQYYSFIEQHNEEIKSDIIDFYHQKLVNKFPDHSYVFDVYRKEAGKIAVLDFNPFGTVTDPLLFTWDELENNSDKELEFRFVKKCFDLQPNPYSHYAMPRDFVDLASGEDPHKLIDFLNLKIQSHGDESDDDT